MAIRITALDSGRSVPDLRRRLMPKNMLEIYSAARLASFHSAAQSFY